MKTKSYGEERNILQVFYMSSSILISLEKKIWICFYYEYKSKDLCIHYVYYVHRVRFWENTAKNNKIKHVTLPRIKAFFLPKSLPKAANIF